jgi:hypothetical protein
MKMKRVTLGLLLALGVTGAAVAQTPPCSDPTKPQCYTPARLTDGTSFYTAAGGGGGAITGPLGSQTSGTSVSVVIASDQGAVATKAASGAIVTCAIVDVGCGPSPGVNTVTYDLGLIYARQPSLNGDGGALAHVTNFPSTQPVSSAAGSFVDCAIYSLGCQSDAAWGGTGPGSEIAIAKAQVLASQAPIPVQTTHGQLIGGVEGIAADGQPAIAYPLRVGGWDGTNIHTLSTDASGHLNVNAPPQAASTGGGNVKSVIVAANTTSFVIDASPGTLYLIDGYSISTGSPVFVKLYNAAQSGVTCGSGTPVDRIMVPAPGTTGGGIIRAITVGDAYSVAITGCITGGLADTDTTVPAASMYIVNFHYK